MDEDCDGMDLDCEPLDTGGPIQPDPNDDIDDGQSDGLNEETPDTNQGRCGCGSATRTSPWAVVSLLGLLCLRRKRP